MLASMGRMDDGIGRLSAPGRFLTTEATEGTEEFDFRRASLGSSVSSAVCFFGFFLSSLATVSASQSAFNLPRDAFLLLVHSAESSSPAICAMFFLLRIEVSYSSMLKP